MSIQTNLHGRLRNTPLPLSHGLMPLFEAVVNSIESIDELGKAAKNSSIIVDVMRLNQKSMNLNSGSGPKEIIIGFNVTDTGVGFNDENMKSFETLDSEHKVDKGGRGVGRLLWLKAFNKIEISSVFKDGDVFKSREFSFNAANGVSDPVTNPHEASKCKTSVRLEGFEEKYQKASGKTLDSIASSLLEHCLWYFVREGSAPKMVINDGSETIELDHLYEEYMHSSAISEKFKVKNEEFEITHIKFRASSSKSHSISFCASKRLVKEDKLAGKVPGLTGRISDENGDFVYSGYIGSPFLDERVSSERTSFDVEEKTDPLFDKEISWEDIHKAALPIIREHLNDYLTANIEAGKKRVEEFVTKKAPRYRPILSRIPENALIVDPAISNKDLDLVLHKHLSRIEGQMLEEGHTIMSPKTDEKSEEYHARLQNYLNTVADMKKSDLANYVSHRRVVLDLLEVAIQRGDDGKYAREDFIHELIMPMRSDSNEVTLDSCNLWLVDERLAFHDYLASDKTLKSMPITGNEETKEPDLLALNVCDNPILMSEGKKLPLASIVVVEIKRPMRNDAKAGEDKDPIEQALGYLNRIRKGSVKTAGGRLIPNSNDIPGFCYVICDITPSIKDRCDFFDLTITSDNLGYFGFHEKFKSYIEVISFDRLLNAAKERNKAFFDKLGLPSI